MDWFLGHANLGVDSLVAHGRWFRGWNTRLLESTAEWSTKLMPIYSPIVLEAVVVYVCSHRPSPVDDELLLVHQTRMRAPARSKNE